MIARAENLQTTLGAPGEQREADQGPMRKSEDRLPLSPGSSSSFCGSEPHAELSSNYRYPPAVAETFANFGHFSRVAMVAILCDASNDGYQIRRPWIPLTPVTCKTPACPNDGANSDAELTFAQNTCIEIDSTTKQTFVPASI